MINTRETSYQTEDFVGKGKPEKLPRPTYWPFFMAMGMTMLLWGILMGWMIALAGALVFFISLAGWIKALNHEEPD